MKTSHSDVTGLTSVEHKFVVFILTKRKCDFGFETCACPHSRVHVHLRLITLIARVTQVSFTSIMRPLQSVPAAVYYQEGGQKEVTNHRIKTASCLHHWKEAQMSSHAKKKKLLLRCSAAK